MKQSEVVIKLLEKYQRCADSDKELDIALMQAYGVNLDERQRDIIRRLNFESARRQRQMLQERGEYPASPKVAQKRRQKAEDVRQSIPFNDSELTTRVISQPPIDWRSMFDH